jgi:hypothetical protein
MSGCINFDCEFNLGGECEKSECLFDEDENEYDENADSDYRRPNEDSEN